MCCCLTFHLSCVLLFFFIIVMCTAVLHFIFIVCLCFSLFALHLSAVHIHMFLPPLQYPHAGLCDNCVGHCFLSMSLPLLSHISFHPCLLQFCLFVSSFPSLSIHDPVLALLSHFVLLFPPFQPFLPTSKTASPSPFWAFRCLNTSMHVLNTLPLSSLLCQLSLQYLNPPI